MRLKVDKESKDGQVVGVELPGIRARTSEQELASLNFETI